MGYRRLYIKDVDKLKDLRSSTIEKAANSIAEYVGEMGCESVDIKYGLFKQRGHIMVHMKPNPEKVGSCIAELLYDYPNGDIAKQIENRVSDRLRRKYCKIFYFILLLL